MKGLSVIGACIYSGVKTGTMYLQDHVLLFVLEGTYIVRFGKKEYKVRKNEMVSLQKDELLFNIVDADEKLLYQFLQPKRREPSSIVKVIEENLMNPVSLNELAYLSGRSLSTFKREFQASFSMDSESSFGESKRIINEFRIIRNQCLFFYWVRKCRSFF